MSLLELTPSRLAAAVLAIGSLCAHVLSRADEPTTTPILRIEAQIHTAAIDRISTDARGSMALTVSHDKTARLWELPSGRLLRVLRPPFNDEDQGRLHSGALSPDGTLAAVGGDTAQDGEGHSCSIYLFDTSTGRLTRRIPGPSDIFGDLAFSPDGRWLASVRAELGGIRVYDVATGQTIGQDKDYRKSSHGLDFSPDGTRLATSSADGFVRLYALSSAGASAAQPQVLRLLTSKAPPGGKDPVGVRFSPDGEKLAIGFYDSTAVAVLSAKDLSFLFAPSTTGVGNGNLESVAWSREGQTLFAGGKWEDAAKRHLVRQWSGRGRGAPLDTSASLTWVKSLRALPGGGVLFAANDPTWGILDGRGKRSLWKPPPVAYFHGSSSVFRLSDDASVVEFAYSDSDKTPGRFSIAERNLQFASDRRALHAANLTGLKVTDWQYSTAPKLNGKPLALATGDDVHALAIAQDKSFFVLGTHQSLRGFSANGARLWKNSILDSVWGVNLSRDGRTVVAACGDGTIRWYRGDTGEELLALFPHADRRRWVLWATELQMESTLEADFQSKEGRVTVEAVDEDGAAMLAGVQEGDQVLDIDGVRATSAAQLDELIRTKTPDTFVAVTVIRGKDSFLKKIRVNSFAGAPKATFYDCSPGAEEIIGWHVNRGRDQAADFFPASKFRDQFYRPDVIQQVLAKGSVEDARQAADEAAGRKASVNTRPDDVIRRLQPPVVELAVGGAQGSAEVEGATFLVRYRVRSSGEPVTRVRLLLDGRPLDIQAPLPAAGALAEARVTVPARECVLAVLAENRFAVSEPVTLRLLPKLSAAPAPPILAAVVKPKLYLLAAGVTKYQHNDQLDNLHFAAKDADDFAAAFRRQEGGLYQKVEAKVLTDAAATAADIRDGLDWIKHQATAKDLAVIFLSGHGENDDELRYFFCAHDYDKNRRLRTGVSMGDIQSTLHNIAGKVLFFIDSCHAGNALGKLFAAKGGSTGVDITRMVNELSGAENGAIVFTSSTGRQLSLELAREENGAFTKAIVEGLDGQADLLHKGTITVSSLETFVAERVKELTDGQQTPTVAKPQTVPDYTIALKR